MVFFCIPCLALILYFLILGIFVPRYRTYIKEAWRCFLDKLRGKKCSVSFDNRMHKAFILWLAKHNRVKLARFFSKKRNFDIFVAVMLVVATIITTWLGWLLYQYLFIKSPCEGSTQPICVG
ncbi:MAG: hypothetical protein V1886_01535 [archaeon]